MERQECSALLKFVYALHPHVEVNDFMVEAALMALEETPFDVAMWALRQRMKDLGRTFPVSCGEILETIAQKQREFEQEEKVKRVLEQKRIEQAEQSKAQALTAEQRQAIVEALRNKHRRLFA